MRLSKECAGHCDQAVQLCRLLTHGSTFEVERVEAWQFALHIATSSETWSVC